MALQLKAESFPHMSSVTYDQQNSKPHDGVSSCCSAGTCYNGECEGLHLSVEERKRHAKWLAPEHQHVIIAAGESAVPYPKTLAAATWYTTSALQSVYAHCGPQSHSSYGQIADITYHTRISLSKCVSIDADVLSGTRQCCKTLQ